MFQWFRRGVDWEPSEAREQFQRGNIPDRAHIRGHLNLLGCSWLTYLPRELSATRVDVSRCANLRGLPEQLTCEVLLLQRTNIQCLSAGLQVSQRIDAQSCRRLEHLLPLTVERLNLSGCTLLQNLPQGLNVRQLELSGCTRLKELPASVASSVAHLDVSDCTAMTALPGNFKKLQSLSVRGCMNLTSLPDDIRIRSWIDVANSGLRTLPGSLRSVRILWRGMQVSSRVAFDPESITVDEILEETNLTMRRLLLDRVGMDWFVSQANAAVIDQDRDAGGERRLLRISFQNGEDVVCIEVRCPSTGSRYVLRVSPRVTTCAEAAAWMADLSNPAAYRPVIET
jgi:hypothetical protein